MGRKIDWVKAGLAKGYKFDGCTNAPDLNVIDCCNRHDYDYQDMSCSRWKADWRLLKCMWKRKKQYVLGPVYWLMVRIFGANHFARKQDEAAIKAEVSKRFNSVDADSM